MRRLPTGGRVDRDAPLRFTFGGREYQGLEGDTLASALLANGLDGAFRSPLLGRPRGVMTAGPEEPCAFVEVYAPWFDLIAPATMVPLVDGLAAAAVAGVGRLPGPELPAPPSCARPRTSRCSRMPRRSASTTPATSSCTSAPARSSGCEVPAAEPCWYVPAEDLSQHFVDLQRDQTVADVAAALETGLRSVEHVKRLTYIGTAVDQGRASGALAAEVVNQLLGAGPGAQGPTNARPPWSPVPFHVLAGPFRGALFDPVRRTPIHAAHVQRGAVFEDVGQWKRPWYFPRGGESMWDAVLRECAAVRTGAGMIDASTLGKIEVVGADAALFLDRMCTNAMSRLEVGRIRYGLMLGLDGMVFDDGVAMRLAADRYLVTTTTGGAARVLARFEEWHQTEWPDLRVHFTSVTEQWVAIAVAGPRSREVLRAAGTDVDVSRDAFPFMTWRDGAVAGVPARLARVSFSGELAFEVHVARWHGRHVWEALLAAGQPFGITPYGTGAMDVLRAEKGYVIVGQDTDGTVTPDDLGMSWIVNLRKGDFVGRRSLRRADLVRPDRRHLVGLLPVERDALIPEGAQLVAAEHVGAFPPVPTLGHVTSSYRSAVLGGTLALALLEGGRERLGSTVYAQTRGESAGSAIAATVTGPVLYDPEGIRRDG